MPSRSALIASIATSAILVLSGCGGSDVKPADSTEEVAVADPTATAETSEAAEETELPSEDDLDEFFGALASDDISRLEDALDLAEEGSIAYAYADYLLQGSIVRADSGEQSYETPPEPTEIDGGYEQCPDGYDECLTWTDIEGRDGKIVNFKLSGEDLSKRITSGNGRVVKAGNLASVEMLYSYESPLTDTLFVILEVKSSKAPIVAATHQAQYRAPDGRQSAVTDPTGVSDLGADSIVSAMLPFPRAEIGGEVTFPIYANNFMTTQNVTIKTR